MKRKRKKKMWLLTVFLISGSSYGHGIYHDQDTCVMVGEHPTVITDYVQSYSCVLVKE